MPRNASNRSDRSSHLQARSASKWTSTAENTLAGASCLYRLPSDIGCKITSRFIPDCAGKIGQIQSDVLRSESLAMSNRLLLSRLIVASVLVGVLVAPVRAQKPVQPTVRLQGAILAASKLTQQRIQELRETGHTTIVVLLSGRTAEERAAEQSAAVRVREAGLDLYYWVEVARSPELADAHPQWMASLQGHPEWRRLFPGTAQPTAAEVVKTYPWVPILSRETFDGQLTRVLKLLKNRVSPNGVYLNDLQGSPSSCGCGSTLCRWTSDYGKKRSTTPLGDDAASLFVAAVRKTLDGPEVIPVWTTECESHDGAKDGLCAGVGCFRGICWKSYTAQLEPLAKHSARLAVLTPFKEFQRDLPVYGPRAGWIDFAVKSFQDMPRRYGRPPIDAQRLITVVQGWNVNSEEIEAQLEISRSAGASGCLIAYTQLDQSWKPKLVPWRQP